MIEQLVQDVAHSLGPWAYLLIGLIAFMETAFFVGFVVPGEFTIVFGGVLAVEGATSISLMVGVVWLCAFAGDTTSFYLGRRLGRGFVLKHGRRLRVTRERLSQVERYFDRHGGKTILIGRFIGLARALAPFTAGTSGMKYRRFLPYDVVGTGLWSTALLLLGFFFWRSFDQVVGVVSRGTLGLGVLISLVVVAVVARRRLRDPARRRQLKLWLMAQSRKTPWRQLAVFLRPVLRLVVRPLLGRFTPGGLGLELTTLLAIAAVGIYVVSLYVSLLAGDLGPTPGDALARAIAKGLRAPWHTELLKIVTQLGRPAIVAAAVVITGIFLIRKRHVIEAVVLATGFVTTWLSVLALKAIVERPRPTGGLIDAAGFSFPSGHAALTVAYVAIAILITRVGLGPLSGTAVITSGIVATAAVGLTRLYLGVHYLSDITAGWALGAAAFAVCGMAGMIVAFMRRQMEADRAGDAGGSDAGICK